MGLEEVVPAAEARSKVCFVVAFGPGYHSQGWIIGSDITVVQKKLFNTKLRGLETPEAGRKAGEAPDWASSVGSFLTGQLAESGMLAAAKNADPKTEAGHLCEAYFYAGSKRLFAKRLFAGDKSTALGYFQKAIATGQKTYGEYAGAAAELKFLKTPKN